MKVRFRVVVGWMVLRVGVVGVGVAVMVRLGVFSMSGLGVAWAELALEEESMVFPSAAVLLTGALWWRTPPAMEKGWFSHTRHVKVGK